jgi:hypothetical protein
MSAHKTRNAPRCDLLRIDAKALRHFVPRQHSLGTQPLETTLQFIFDRHATDHATGEWLAIAGRRTPRVQEPSDGVGRMVIK